MGDKWAGVRRELLIWQTSCFVLAASLLGVILLNGYGLLAVPGAIDFQRAGSWGDFVGTFGTVGALSIALYTSLHEAQKSRELAAEVLHEKRLAKTRVYAWLEPEVEQGVHTWKIRLRNDLDAPIYNWAVDVVGSDDEASGAELGPIFPGSKSLIAKGLRGTSPAKAPKVVLRFEAPDGRWWRRDEDRGSAAATSTHSGSRVLAPQCKAPARYWQAIGTPRLFSETLAQGRRLSSVA